MGYMPDQPDEAVSLTETGGLEPITREEVASTGRGFKSR
jgi:hypothetical protein